MCIYTYPDGTKCQQTGRKLDDVFYQALNHYIVKLSKATLVTVDENSEQREVMKFTGVERKRACSGRTDDGSVRDGVFDNLLLGKADSCLKVSVTSSPSDTLLGTSVKFQGINPCSAVAVKAVRVFPLRFLDITTAW